MPISLRRFSPPCEGGRRFPPLAKGGAPFFPPLRRGGRGGGHGTIFAVEEVVHGLSPLSFCIPLARREESFSVPKAPAPPPLAPPFTRGGKMKPPSQGGEKDRSLAPSFDRAQEKHASRTAFSSGNTCHR